EVASAAGARRARRTGPRRSRSESRWPRRRRSGPPGPVPRRTRPDSWRAGTRADRTPSRCADRRGVGWGEVINPGGVADGDLALGVLGQVAEPLAGHRDRVGPGGIRVRVVAFGHHVVFADDVQQPQAGLVLDERAVAMVGEQPADVGVQAEPGRALLLAALVAGVHRYVEARGPEPLLVDDLLGALEEVGDPADRPLRQRDLQYGEGGEVAAEQPVEQRTGL